VTGSNKGIGFGIVKELCAKFDGNVYLTSRNEERGLSAVNELKKLGLHANYHTLDIDEEASVVRFRDYLKVKYGGLDVLVNNAAIAFKSNSAESLGKQAALTIETNFFNTCRACNILFPILRPHARVVNLSSAAGHLLMITNQEKVGVELRNTLSANSLTEEELKQLMRDYVDAENKEDHEDHGWPDRCYVVSKIALSALTRIQQREFDRDGREDLIVNSADPGWVDTDMSGHRGVLTIEEGAANPSWLALLPKGVQGPKGGFVWYTKEIVDWIHGPVPASLYKPETK